jgi:hypothetical protein
MNKVPVTKKQALMIFLKISNTLDNEQLREIYLDAMKGIFEIKIEQGLSIQEAYLYALERSVR